MQRCRTHRVQLAFDIASIGMRASKMQRDVKALIAAATPRLQLWLRSLSYRAGRNVHRHDVRPVNRTKP